MNSNSGKAMEEDKGDGKRESVLGILRFPELGISFPTPPSSAHIRNTSYEPLTQNMEAQNMEAENTNGMRTMTLESTIDPMLRDGRIWSGTGETMSQIWSPRNHATSASLGGHESPQDRKKHQRNEKRNDSLSWGSEVEEDLEQGLGQGHGEIRRTVSLEILNQSRSAIQRLDEK
jgi:hypothetical protein